MKKTIQIPSNLTRMASIREEQMGEKTVKRVSISSDVPYLRYDWRNDEDYYEVLSHDPADIDDARLKLGLPILFNHDRDSHLGRAKGFANDGHRIDVGTMDDLIWSTSDFAQSKKADVENGSLVGTSVGYKILDDGECIGAKDGIPIYKFRWAPHEFSFCTIEADTTVGAGRSRDKEAAGEMQEISISTKDSVDKTGKNLETDLQTSDMKSKNRKFHEADKGDNATTGTAATIDVVKERGNAVNEFKSRCKRIDDYVEGLKNPQWKQAAQTIAAKHKNGEADFDSFRTEALDAFEGVTRVDAGATGEIGMSKKELKRYSLARAIYLRGTGKPLDGLEKEASDATAKVLRKDADGFYIPEDWSGRSLTEIHGLGASEQERQMDFLRNVVSMASRALTVGNFASAGSLVGTDLLAGSMIELLRNKAVVMSLGPTTLSGLVGNVAIPKQVGAATAYWLPEGGTVTASDQQFAQLGLMPHRLTAQTAYDKQLVAQASVSVEAIVRNDIALVMALKKDLAALQGSGNSGEPLGIANTTGVQTVTFGAAATWAKVLEFETDLATANADQTGTPVWLTNPSVRGKWKAAPKVSASTFPIFLWGDATGANVVNGYAAYVTNQVPTTGTGANLVYFFVPGELIVADWAGIDVVVNPFSLDSTGQIRTTVTQWTDLAVRHPGAFVVSTDSGAQ